MAKLIDLLLLYGGRSGEHEVSLTSAASVFAHLNKEKYRIIPVAMDKKGQFHLHDASELLAYKEKLPVVTEYSKPLDHFMVQGGLSVKADVVFPVVHGPLYEDGCLQGLLDLANVAYVGCGVLSSSVGMDKDMTRRLVCIQGIKSANYRLLSWRTPAKERQPFCSEVSRELGWPLFVKPCSLGSSVGIRKVKNEAQLLAAVEDALRYDKEVIIEEFIQGRELELAVLESPLGFPKVSVVGEIRVHHPDGFYSYSAKYLESDQTDLLVPAALSTSLTENLQQASREVFTRLKCEGMARVDFFVKEETNEIYFNEVNTLPGFTAISMYPKLWQASGLAYADLLDELIALAIIRHKNRQNLVTDYL